MKIFTLIFLFVSINTFAQNSVSFRMDSLLREGVQLEQGWKFQVGDNPQWANPEFDDSAWGDINPVLDVYRQRKIDINQPFWLRLKIYTKSPRNIVFTLKQSGATEIYFKGKLLFTLGKIGDAVHSQTIAYTPNNRYFTAALDSGMNTLAVRYHFESNLRYKQVMGHSYPLFLVNLYNENQLESNVNRSAYVWQGIDIGIPLILFVFHFVVFLFYTPNKANLWFSMWALANLMVWVFAVIIVNTNDIRLQNTYDTISLILSVTSNFFLFYCISLLMAEKDRRFLLSFLMITITTTLFFFVLKSRDQILTNFSTNLVYIFLLIWMGIRANKRGNFGGRFLIFGVVLFLILWTMFLISIRSDAFSQVSQDILFHLANLTIPVIIATLIGLDLQKTNLSLKSNLQEVQKLSAEKQQILATQNEILEKQVAERTAELQSSQAQLIQSEKLASLGELTAGIAHEIQNPLNFVNNFSELSVDLAKDIQEEMHKPDADKRYLDELLTDLTQNQQKINHHGKRAAAIVTGMLQHARTSSGKKESTDLNALADEYLRLSYHGLRAKNPDFNAAMVTDFDLAIGRVEVIPQDIGRVLLNLINNAFYAVHQRRLGNAERLDSSTATYEPTVTISTQKINNQIVMKVKDNGTGIPEAVKAKIFQPFFTTKPTGEGTGLGLSLAYDIVVKGHGGALEVESTEGVGTTFVLSLSSGKI